MQARLAGKTALITGGSRGIGAAIAERYAAEGADILIGYAGNHAAAEQAVSRLRAAGVKADAVQADAGTVGAAGLMADKAASFLGGVDILVHSAGISEFLSLADSDEAAYLDALRRHHKINVEMVAALTKAVLPLMRNGGRIIIVGSVNAHQMPFPGTAIYGSTKAAVAALAHGWARDLGPRNILVNVIQPGPIETDMNPNDGREVVGVMTAMTALKRYGQPGEIAGLAAFLASGDSSYITGATIDIDGGFSL